MLKVFNLVYRHLYPSPNCPKLKKLYQTFVSQIKLPEIALKTFSFDLVIFDALFFLLLFDCSIFGLCSDQTTVEQSNRYKIFKKK